MKTIPEDITGKRYFVEIQGTTNERWALFKRQEIIDPEEFKTKKGEIQSPSFADTLISNEGHPWNLGGGVLNTWEHAIDLNTIKFLEFLVESLNKNSTPFPEHE